MECSNTYQLFLQLSIPAQQVWSALGQAGAPLFKKVRERKMLQELDVRRLGEGLCLFTRGDVGMHITISFFCEEKMKRLLCVHSACQVLNPAVGAGFIITCVVSSGVQG